MNIECPICFNNISNQELCTTSCNHSYCYDCLKKWLDKNKKTCPNCRKEIDYFKYNNETNRLIFITYPINLINNGNININRNNRIINKNVLLLLQLLSSTSIIFMGSTIFLYIDLIENI